MNREHFLDVTRNADIQAVESARAAVLRGAFATRAPADVNPYAPFSDTAYPFYGQVGSLLSSEWTELRAEADAGGLVHGLPYARSRVRPGGLAAWDASVAVPAIDGRDHPQPPSKLLARRNTNTEWTSMLLPGLLASANPEPACVPGVVDLRRRGDFGWSLINAAHVLVHRRNHRRPDADPKTLLGAYHSDMCRAAAELVFGMLYGTRVYIGSRDNYKAGQANADYRLKIVGGGGALARPVLSLPWAGTGALAIDQAAACVCMGLSIAPAPYQWYVPEFEPKAHHKWTGLPCTFVVAGWEGVDMVTHAQLIQSDIGLPNPRAMPRYTLPVQDLWPQSTVPALLAAGEAGGHGETGSDWAHVSDWMASEAYAAAAAETPPLPCEDCVRIRTDTIDAPERPAASADAGDWWRYVGTIRRLLRSVRTVAEDADAHVLGADWAYAKKARTDRTRAYARRQRVFADVHTFQDIQARRAKGLALTRTMALRYQKLLDAYGLPVLSELSKTASGAT